MKKMIKGFVVAQQYPWDDEPHFTFVGFDPIEHRMDNYILVCAHSFEIDIPDDFDVRPHQVAALNNRKKELSDKYISDVKQINDQISSLLAIGTAKVVDDGTTD
jgi:hypothetical protein